MKKLLFFFLYLNFVSCNSCKDFLTPNINQLPPITQVGANTFGAIINGKVWVPAGSNNGTGNLTIHYDPGYAFGTLSVSAYRQIDTVAYHTTRLGFALDSLNNYPIPSTFSLKSNSNNALDYTQYPCVYGSEDSSTKSSGSIIITKLDTANRIISGTFSGVLIKAGCDTVNISDGRFDMKLH